MADLEKAASDLTADRDLLKEQCGTLEGKVNGRSKLVTYYRHRCRVLEGRCEQGKSIVDEGDEHATTHPSTTTTHPSSDIVTIVCRAQSVTALSSAPTSSGAVSEPLPKRTFPGAQSSQWLFPDEYCQ